MVLMGGKTALEGVRVETEAPITVGGGKEVKDFRVRDADPMPGILHIIRERAHKDDGVIEGYADTRISFRVNADGSVEFLGAEVGEIRAQRAM